MHELTFGFCGNLTKRQDFYRAKVLEKGAKFSKDGSSCNILVIPDSCSFQYSDKFKRIFAREPMIIQETKLRDLLCMDDKIDNRFVITDVIEDNVIKYEDNYSDSKIHQQRFVILRTYEHAQKTKEKAEKYLCSIDKKHAEEMRRITEKEWNGSKSGFVYDQVIYKFVDEEEIILKLPKMKYGVTGKGEFVKGTVNEKVFSRELSREAK